MADEIARLRDDLTAAKDENERLERDNYGKGIELCGASRALEKVVATLATRDRELGEVRAATKLQWIETNEADEVIVDELFANAERHGGRHPITPTAAPEPETEEQHKAPPAFMDHDHDGGYDPDYDADATPVSINAETLEITARDLPAPEPEETSDGRR